MAGILYGVGVGPGDPELLTIKAVNALKAADVVVAPKAKETGKSTALSVVRPYLSSHTDIVKMVFPMVKGKETLIGAWTENSREILGYLQEGKKVAFITLGDPMLYSTYGYVFTTLRDCGHEIVTIPGITSYAAIAAMTGITLAEGDGVLTIVPAVTDEKNLERILETADNLVILKAYRNYRQIVERLKKSGHTHDAVMVSRCGLPEERICHELESIGEEGIDYLSTIIAKKR